ncbi:hypothetical protein PAXRUDRAFT_831905 [Paxillus rubicundulus Ve08.2h10]|uniref:Uncharacterized protein n=1 Tax=Paxillus rubicundulus Ve08.2h10 TaxID=930991 RepID=A0A0D0DL95_9AGAM|nr:hypothetical protein PAXRUDRAFT_831905 [Paxillus rubicundulus Ve08.2h10]
MRKSEDDKGSTTPDVDDQPRHHGCRYAKAHRRAMRIHETTGGDQQEKVNDKVAYHSVSSCHHLCPRRPGNCIHPIMLCLQLHRWNTGLTLRTSSKLWADDEENRQR